MVVKVLELKNCNTEPINIGSYIVNSNETFRIALNKISNVMWKNIIALVNKKEAEYKVVDVKEEPKEVIENTKIEEPKEEKTTIKKTTKKKETTKGSTTKKRSTTKKKKEEN